MGCCANDDDDDDDDSLILNGKEFSDKGRDRSSDEYESRKILE
jgi:hypothetical protein